MKKSFVKITVMLAVGMLMLAGCGEEKDLDQEIVGKDWRTTASFIPGTLKHEEEIKVLAELETNKLTVFYDKEVKEKYASVDIPCETTDMQATVNSLQFGDLNEDGYTDMLIYVFDQQGEKADVEFLWDKDNHSFLCIAPSSEAEGNFSFLNFIGSWEIEEEKIAILISEDHTWTAIADGEITCQGEVVIDGGTVILYKPEGIYYCRLTYGDKSVIDEYENAYTYAGPVEAMMPEQKEM